MAGYDVSNGVNMEELKPQPEFQGLDKKDKKERRPFKVWLVDNTYELVSIFLSAVVIIMIIFTFFCRFVGVIGESMEPTLHSMDWVVLSQMGEYTPKYGDIVVISQPNSYNENIVKRVIATGGQTVDIDFATGDVFVDNNKLNEPYLNNATTNHYDMSFPLEVPEGYCFVMGDNRQNSIDSRSTIIGLIRYDYILGEAQNAITSSDGFKNLQMRN